MNLLLSDLPREEKMLRRLGAPDTVFALNHRLKKQLDHRPATQLTGFITKSRSGWLLQSSLFPSRKKPLAIPLVFEKGVDLPQVEGVISVKGRMKTGITGSPRKGQKIRTEQFFAVSDWTEDHVALWKDFTPPFSGKELLEMFGEVVSLPKPLDLALLLAPTSSPHLDHNRRFSGGSSAVLSTSSLKPQDVDFIAETVSSTVPSWHQIEKAPGFEFFSPESRTPKGLLDRLRRRYEPRELSAILPIQTTGSGLNRSSPQQFVRTIISTDDPVIAERSDVALDHGRGDFHKYQKEIQFSLLCLHAQLALPFHLNDLHSSFEYQCDLFLKTFQDKYPQIWTNFYQNHSDALRKHHNRKILLGRLVANRARFFQKPLDNASIVKETFACHHQLLGDLENAIEIGRFDEFIDSPPIWEAEYQLFYSNLMLLFDEQVIVSWEDIVRTGEKAGLNKPQTLKFLQELINDGSLYSSNFDPETGEGDFKRI